MTNLDSIFTPTPPRFLPVPEHPATGHPAWNPPHLEDSWGAGREATRALLWKAWDWRRGQQPGRESGVLVLAPHLPNSPSTCSASLGHHLSSTRGIYFHSSAFLKLLDARFQCLVCGWCSVNICIFLIVKKCVMWLPSGSVVKNSPASAGDAGDVGSIPRPGRPPGRRNGSSRQHSWENPMDRGAGWAAGPGVAESDTTEWLSTRTIRSIKFTILTGHLSHSQWCTTITTTHSQNFFIF